jgi:hypothetical protein
MQGHSNQGVVDPPDFPWRLLALAKFMRLSLTKAAHAVLSSAAYRKSGSSIDQREL